MRIIKEKFKTDRSGGLYWGRVYFVADNRAAKTKLLWAMSFEWVRRQLLSETWENEAVEKLANRFVVNKIKETKRKIFSLPVKFLALGLGPKDQAELMSYLRQREEADRPGNFKS